MLRSLTDLQVHLEAVRFGRPGFANRHIQHLTFTSALSGRLVTVADTKLKMIGKI